MAKQRSGRRSSGPGGSGARRPSGGPSGARSGPKRPATDHHEVEWQFDAAEVEPVEGWLGHHSSGSGLAIVPEPDQAITDAYYDTEDWRFYRAGYALRVRDTGGEVEATMKSLAPAEDGVRRRREISELLKDDAPASLSDAPGPVGERLRALVGDRELRRMFEIRTRRRRFALLLEPTDPDGAGDENDGAAEGGVRIGEVSLDTSEIPLGEGVEPASLRRVEVEAGVETAQSPDLRGFVDEMQFDLGLSPASVSKYEAGLYATGLSPDGEAKLGPTGIDASMSIGRVAFAVLRRQFTEMRAHEPGTRLGEDPEELHDMRVATRRMRAAIKLFEGALPARAGWLRDELRWIAGALGRVRDLDVQMERLRTWKEKTDYEEAAYLDKVLGLARKRWAEAREGMLEALDSGRYERFESSFAEMLRRGPGAEPELAPGDGDPSSEPVTSAAPPLISRRYRKWRKAARRLDEASDPEDFHEVRKKGKRLRYALEFVSEVYGGPVGDLVKPLKELQDDLGDHQDAVVASEYLRVLGTTTGGTRVARGVAFTMGVYSERCAREAACLRSDVLEQKPLRLLTKGKVWKGFERVMRDAHADREARDTRKVVG